MGPMSRRIVLTDLDGTIADSSHRAHHITGGNHDWTSFNAKVADDTPLEETIYLLTMLHDLGHLVLIVTGRSEETREDTVAWLAKHDVPYDELHMRSRGDFEPSYVIKRLMALNAGAQPENTLGVFEDRIQDVVRWRTAGYQVWQVAEGDY